MRYLAAYLLLQIGGNASPSADDIKKVLDSVGIEADEERLSKLLSELEGKDVNALIAEGSSKLASVRTSIASSSTSVSFHCRFPLAVLLLRLLVLVVRLPLLPPRRPRRRRRRRRRFVSGSQAFYSPVY